MAQKPGEAVRSAYEAFGRGDIPTVLALMAPDVEWVESDAALIPTRGTHVGPGGVAEHVFASIPRDWDEFVLTPEDFFEDGDTVVVRGRLRGVAKATGRTIDAPFVHIFTFEGDTISRMTNHHDTALWVEALVD